MGNNASHLSSDQSQSFNPSNPRRSSNSSKPFVQHKERRSSSASSSSSTPAKQPSPIEQLLPQKSKPTASISKISTTHNNLFLDNIIAPQDVFSEPANSNGSGGNQVTAPKTQEIHDYAEGEVIECRDFSTNSPSLQKQQEQADYFSYKDFESPEINNELSLPSNEDDDTALFDDDDAIYTPGLEEQRELMREEVEVRFYEEGLTGKDTVYVVGNFNTTANANASNKEGSGVSLLQQFQNKIRLVPFLEHSEVKYFHADLNLPIGIYKCKFSLNNKQVKISNEMPIATDKSGNVVNWFEVKPRSNQLYDYYQNRSGTVSKKSLLQNVKDTNEINPVLQNVKANNSTTSSFNLTLTKERLHYSKEIPEMFVPFIPNLSQEEDQLAPEIDPSFLEKHPIAELPIYLNNTYLNRQFNQVHNSGNHTPNGGHHPGQGNTTMKGLNFHIVPHVNLNHLLTSNIKNEVLTVAATTRYQGKFVTQIMYSPAYPAEEKEEEGN